LPLPSSPHWAPTKIVLAILPKKIPKNSKNRVGGRDAAIKIPET
jgi:hypothetical protein